MSKNSKPSKLSAVKVTVHSSQFPEQVRQELSQSLGSRRVNHKFHYDSYKQAQKWLALHETYSPARTDPDCMASYARGFAATASRIAANRVDLIGLGCGGGQKDAQLIAALHRAGKQVSYTPCDTSVAMVLVAREAALRILSESKCFPLVVDLATAEDLPATFAEVLGPDSFAPDTIRLYTAFGIIPNFEPAHILPKLADLVRSKDLVLISSNLAPGADYGAGVQRVLSQYDNELTRNWLMTLLFDLGVEEEDGDLNFLVEDDSSGSSLKRISGYYMFKRTRTVHLDQNHFKFKPGEAVRLFFSYRYTCDLLRTLLDQQGLQVLDHWVSNSEEEGVFLVGRVL